MSDAPASPRPVALVTGAAIRVGRAIAVALCEAGYRVWLHHHRSEVEARALHAALSATEGAPLPLVAADLLDEGSRRALMTTVLDPAGPAGGRLDLLVNNAASFERGAFTARDDHDLRRVLELNLVAPLSLARAAASALVPREGSIVNILDVAAVHPWPEYLDHCTAKAGLLAATRGLAVELAPVRVNGVAPGTVAWPPGLDDPARRQAIVDAIPLGRIGTPADVADAVLFLARSRHVTGQILAVDGGRLAAAGGQRP
ncbi:MAG: SDR family oxidoreductase [Myxococcales bacterium]|nr:SDR family oxidoreductase [Myxococcales bacterium]